MAYQVLARKWRPRKFSEMVGQTHVLRALMNALDNDRLHHAYLFTGTRGVGKTTIARIFAKSLNCETQGVSSNPCGQCRTCTEVDQGRFIDLIEVDAASRTGVDDTRELLDNVQYAPSRGRYKVYLIDEVHMLTKQSFNALLKTLEEPPPHVKFLLATTDPQKLLPTVLSRCLQFNLKRLPLELIAQHLTRIVETEQVPFEPSALLLLATAADGSMRDALSLLDQAIAFGAGQLLTTEVNAMLGTMDKGAIVRLVQALADNAALDVLTQTAQLAEQNPDFSVILNDILVLLQKIALAQVIPNSLDNLLPENEIILALAQQLSPEEVQLFYQIALTGRRDLPLAPEPRGGFEMILLRILAFRPVNSATALSTVTSAPPRPAPMVEGKRPVSTQSPAASPSTSPASVARAMLQKTAVTPPVTTSVNVPPAIAGESTTHPQPLQKVETATTFELNDNSDWTLLINQMPLEGLIQQLATNCSFIKRENMVVQLALTPEYKPSLLGQEKLEKALQSYLGQAIKLNIRVEQASQSLGDSPAAQQQQQQQQQRQQLEHEIHNDPFVVECKKQFEARVTKIIPKASESTEK